MTFDGIWAVLDRDVASGRLPGYVAAVRLRAGRGPQDGFDDFWTAVATAADPRR